MGLRSRFLEGEWAWISGASSGIGRTLALRLSEEGVHLFLSARRENELESLAEEIRSKGGQAEPLPLDVSDPEAIQQAAKTIKEKAGRLDMVIPSAGSELLLPLEMVSPAKWKKVLDVHILGAFEMARCSIKMLKSSGARENGQGRLVLISSVVGLKGYAAQLAYSTCKAGLLGGMRSLAVELAPFGIRVNAVIPGLVQTPMQERSFARMPSEKQEEMIHAHPLGLGTPEDVAAAVAFLASYDAQWITGAGLVVDGGLSVA